VIAATLATLVEGSAFCGLFLCALFAAYMFLDTIGGG
jgi:hypothetical protein